MTDLERAREALLKFSPIQAVMALVEAARREGAEQASGEIRALRKALHEETMKRLASAEEMRERAAQTAARYEAPIWSAMIAAAIRALPLTPEEPT